MSTDKNSMVKKLVWGFILATAVFFICLVPHMGAKAALNSSMFSFNITLAKAAVALLLAMHTVSIKQMYLPIAVACIINMFTADCGIWSFVLGAALVAGSFIINGKKPTAGKC